MRPDGPQKDLTEAQKKMAMIAGVPADRVGLGAEYPKMVYRPGPNEHHSLLGEPLKVGGFESETAFVDSYEDEQIAIEQGWFLSPDPTIQAKETQKRQVERAKDSRIAELEAQLAGQQVAANQPEKRGPGRPPKLPDAAA